MIIWDRKIPDYLVNKNNIYRTVIFTAIFALAFINFYEPFGVNFWLEVTKVTLLFYSSLVILTGMLTILISRILMFQYCKTRSLTYFGYFFWVFVEILSMSLFYTFFLLFFLNDKRDFLKIFEVSIKNTALVLLLPYSILYLYFAWREKDKQLEGLSNAEEAKLQARRLIPFYDEKGTLRISIKAEDIIYLEAADNYVTIYYFNGAKMSKYLVRNTIKNLEIKLQSYNIVRCHRSFMVNFNRVRVMKRDKDGLVLELEAEPTINLPVSKTYLSTVTEAFSVTQ